MNNLKEADAELQRTIEDGIDSVLNLVSAPPKPSTKMRPLQVSEPALGSGARGAPGQPTAIAGANESAAVIAKKAQLKEMLGSLLERRNERLHESITTVRTAEMEEDDSGAVTEFSGRPKSVSVGVNTELGKLGVWS